MRLTRVIVAIALAAGAAPAALAGQQGPEWQLYGTAAKKRAFVTVGDARHKTKATLSMQLAGPVGTPQALALARLEVWAPSVDVLLPQQSAPQPTGVLSIQLVSPTPVTFDDDGRTFRADVVASLHYPLIDRVMGFRTSPDAPQQDTFDVFTDTMRGQLVARLRRPLPPDLPKERPFPVKAVANLHLVSDGQLLGTRYTLDVSRRIRLTLWREILDLCSCPSKRLCIQPVGVKSNAADPSPTGTAFAGQLAEADDLWNRVCVVFEVRPFMYVVNADWKTMTYDSSPEDPASEQALLRASVDVDDCVEVFYIDSWTNPEANGGGATWGSGTASAKIITSDAVDNGIDLNHLAHEIGHALTLCHPGCSCAAPRIDGTPNTVMCPSGWENDNPDNQSEENGDNASNPLLEFVTSLICPDPDCTDSGDCGAFCSGSC
jgi:hypothetical protein